MLKDSFILKTWPSAHPKLKSCKQMGFGCRKGRNVGGKHKAGLCFKFLQVLKRSSRKQSGHVEHDLKNSHPTGKQQQNMARFWTKYSVKTRLNFLKVSIRQVEENPLHQTVARRVLRGLGHAAGGLHLLQPLAQVAVAGLQLFDLIQRRSQLQGQTRTKLSQRTSVKAAHLWLASEANFLPLSAVCVSPPSARPPPSLRSPLQICNASPDPPAWSPGQEATRETTDGSN